MENNRGLRVTIPSNILRSTKNQIASLLYRLQISEANKEIKSSNYKARGERERERERERESQFALVQNKHTKSQRPKWPNTTFFGNFQQKNTVSEINNKVPLFLELEFQKLEFLISFAIVALLSWNLCNLKKIMWYLSLVNSSTIYIVLEYTRLEYLFKKKKKITQYSSLVNSSIV